MFVKDKAEISNSVEWDVLSEQLCIFSQRFLSPKSRNSVLGKLRVRRFAVHNVLITVMMMMMIMMMIIITSVPCNLAKDRIADLSPLAAANRFVRS